MTPHIRCCCGQSIELADEARGRNTQCPRCGAPMFVPNLASVVALSNVRGQRVGNLALELERIPESLPFFEEPRGIDLDDEGYEPPMFSPRRPR
jgi:hypothetical protein